MQVERSTLINYRCPGCRQVFRFTFQKLLYGFVICPKCGTEHVGIILSEASQELSSPIVNARLKVQANLRKN